LSRGGKNPSVNTERRGRAEFNGKFVVRRIVSRPRYRKGMDDSIAGRMAAKSSTIYAGHTPGELTFGAPPVPEGPCQWRP
jgi:hypothetical protein